MLDTGKTKFEQCQKCVVAVAIPHFCFRYSVKPKNIFDTAHNCWSAHCSSHWISCVKSLRAHWLKRSQTYFFIMWHIVSITAKTKTVHAAVPFKLHSVMVDTILMKTHEPRKNGSSDFLLPWIIQYFLKMSSMEKSDNLRMHWQEEISHLQAQAPGFLYMCSHCSVANLFSDSSVDCQTEITGWKRSQTYSFIMWHMERAYGRVQPDCCCSNELINSVMVDTILMKTHEPRKNGSSEFLLPWIIQ